MITGISPEDEIEGTAEEIEAIEETEGETVEMNGDDFDPDWDQNLLVMEGEQTDPDTPTLETNPRMQDIAGAHRVMLILNTGAMKIDNHIVKAQQNLKDIQAVLVQLEAEAVMNWDPKTKQPVDPNLLYNDGSNPEQRQARSYNLFPSLHDNIYKGQREIFVLQQELAKIKHRMSQMKLVVDYYDRFIRYQEMCVSLENSRITR